MNGTASIEAPEDYASRDYVLDICDDKTLNPILEIAIEGSALNTRPANDEVQAISCETKRFTHLEYIYDNIRNLLGVSGSRNQTAEALFNEFGEIFTSFQQLCKKI